MGDSVPAEEPMKIFVKTLSFGTITLNVVASDTIGTIGRKCRDKIDSMFQGFDIEAALGAEAAAVLSFEGHLLEDDRALWDYNIQQGSTIRSTFGLAGGGSPHTIP